MGHKLTSELSEHLPFNVHEAGFDDGKYDSKYKTIFLQVAESNQNNLLENVTKLKPAGYET